MARCGTLAVAGLAVGVAVAVVVAVVVAPWGTLCARHRRADLRLHSATPSLHRYFN